MTKYLYVIKILLVGAFWGYIGASLVGQFVGVGPLPGVQYFWMVVPLTILIVVHHLFLHSR